MKREFRAMNTNSQFIGPPFNERNDDDNASDDDIYIMMKCLCVCHEK